MRMYVRKNRFIVALALIWQSEPLPGRARECSFPPSRPSIAKAAMETAGLPGRSYRRRIGNGRPSACLDTCCRTYRQKAGATPPAFSTESRLPCPPLDIMRPNRTVCMEVAERNHQSRGVPLNVLMALVLMVEVPLP